MNNANFCNFLVIFRKFCGLKLVFYIIAKLQHISEQLILAKLGFPLNYGGSTIDKAISNKGNAATLQPNQSPNFNIIQTQKLNDELQKAHRVTCTKVPALAQSLAQHQIPISDHAASISASELSCTSSVRSGNSFAKLIRQFKQTIQNNATVHDISVATVVTESPSIATDMTEFIPVGTDVPESASNDLSSTIDVFINSDVEEETRKMKEEEAGDITSDVSFEIISNTPVTKMYEKFDDEELERSQSITSECPGNRFVQAINTQKQVTSSVQNGTSAFPLHFDISPIVLSDDDVIENNTYLQSNKRPLEISSNVAPGSSAEEKLKKFAFRPRNQK